MQKVQEQHRAQIIEQFSQQAITFLQVPGHFDAMQILVALSQVSSHDTVLDVACGPGIVACHFARLAAGVTGVDITPAMIEQAKVRQRQEGLQNLSWVVGDAIPLPFADDSFSLVITRYSFHHLLSPADALAEMIRVCKPGGRVLVADVEVEAAKSVAYDRLESIRDPSHTHALTQEEFAALFRRSGLIGCQRGAFGVEIELEQQLRASFPAPGDEALLRQLVSDDVGVDSLGIDARWLDGKIVYTVPIAAYLGRKG